MNDQKYNTTLPERIITPAKDMLIIFNNVLTGKLSVMDHARNITLLGDSSGIAFVENPEAPDVSLYKAGDQWFDTDDIVLYMLYDNGSQKVWLEIGSGSVTENDVSMGVRTILNGSTLKLNMDIVENQILDINATKETPIDTDSLGLWNSVINKFVRFPIIDLKSFLNLLSVKKDGDTMTGALTVPAMIINGGVGLLSKGLVFGDGDSGIYENTDDILYFICGNQYKLLIGGSQNQSISFVPLTSNIYSLGSDIRRWKSLYSNTITDDGTNVGIGNSTPKSKLDVAGGIQCADDTAAASANKVGTTRYRTDANNSYCEMCMQTGASTYAWVIIKQNTW